jgi:hypothetical protein
MRKTLRVQQSRALADVNRESFVKVSRALSARLNYPADSTS